MEEVRSEIAGSVQKLVTWPCHSRVNFGASAEAFATAPHETNDSTSSNTTDLAMVATSNAGQRRLRLRR